jgi:hypothetical protein
MLFREDLEEVVNIFRASNEESVVVLADGDRPYASFDEMQKISGAQVAHLVLINHEVGIKLELQKGSQGLVLTTVKASDEADLAFHRTKDFLQSRKRKAHFWLGYVLPWVCLAISLISFYPLYLRRTEVIHGILWVYGLVCLSAFTVLMCSNTIFEGSRSFVTLKRRHEWPPFVKRNRDGLILMFIGSVIGAILGVCGTLIVQHFTK